MLLIRPSVRPSVLDGGLAVAAGFNTQVYIIRFFDGIRKTFGDFLLERR